MRENQTHFFKARANQICSSKWCLYSHGRFLIHCGLEVQFGRLVQFGFLIGLRFRVQSGFLIQLGVRYDFRQGPFLQSSTIEESPRLYRGTSRAGNATTTSTAWPHWCFASRGGSGAKVTRHPISTLSTSDELKTNRSG